MPKWTGNGRAGMGGWRRIGAAVAGVCAMTLISSSVEAERVEVMPGAAIVVDEREPGPVHRAVGDLQRDLEKVLGERSPVKGGLGEVEAGQAALVVVGPEADWPGLEVSQRVAGWESHAVYVASIEGQRHVILHGADMRGAIYAIYTFAEELLGVPPLWLWASWEPEAKDAVAVPGDFHLHFDPPEVRWRGWFPNDTTALTPWRRISEANHDAHAETMLRLKLNLLDMISHMDEGYRESDRLAANARMAKRYGLIVTTTHTSPFGAHLGERRWRNYWQRVREMEPPPRSLERMDALREYWQHYIDATLSHELEMIWTIGFRSPGDLPFWERVEGAPDESAQRAAIIQQILEDQVELLKQRTGDASPVMRVVLYNEKSQFMASDYLRPPNESNLIWNFVAARRDHFPADDVLTFELPADQKVGYYFNYQFTSTGSHLAQGEGPWKMERNFRMVRDRGGGELALSMVNAGNVREHVMELAANAAMMWDFDGYDSDAFLEAFAGRYFGHEHAEAVARLYRDFYDAYWRQKEPTLAGFERQYIFQDLRLNRAMRLLVPLLKEGETEMNPFWSGDWFRIDPAATGAETEVEAVIRGLERSIERLAKVTRRADELRDAMDERGRRFFDDNLRLQAYFLKHASETVHHLAEAMAAQDQGREGRRRHHIEQADEAVQRMSAVLGETEHGRFESWYVDRRSEGRTLRFDFYQRRDDIAELRATLD